MSMTGTDKIFKINDTEYGYNVYSFMPGPSGLKIEVYVPKLMGAITDEGERYIDNDKLFINADECMPLYDRKIKLTKSFHATLKNNCMWLDKINSAGVCVKNTQFVIEFLNGNITQPYVTTK